MISILRRRSSWVLPLLSAGILLLAVSHLDASVALRLLGHAGAAACLVLVPHALSMTLEAFAWRESITSVGVQSRFSTIWRIRTATEALYLLLPGGIVFAESIKPLLLSRCAGLSLELSIGATFYRKFLRLAGQGPYVLGAAMGGGPALAMLSQAWFSSPILEQAVLLTGAAFLGLSWALAVSMRHAALATRTLELLKRWPRVFPREALGRLTHRFHQTDQAARSFFRLPLRKILVPILCSGVCWLFEPLESWIALQVLGLDVSFLSVLGIDVAISLLRQAAVFLPAGIGIQEVGYAGALMALGVPEPLESALAFSVLKRFKDVAWGTFGLALLPQLLNGVGLSKGTESRSSAALKALGGTHAGL